MSPRRGAGTTVLATIATLMGVACALLIGYAVHFILTT